MMFFGGFKPTVLQASDGTWAVITRSKKGENQYGMFPTWREAYDWAYGQARERRS